MVRLATRLSADAKVSYFEMGEETDQISYAQLWEDAGRIASGLLNRGLQPEERVALIVPTCAASLRGFFGVLAAGGIPVTLPPPLPFSNPERYAQRIRGALAASRIRRLLGPSNLDDYMRSFAEGRVGEVHIRGACVMRGYDLNEEATRAAFREDGWLATGDLGFLHGGELYLVGRIKDVIIVGGHNVYATDVEHAAGRVPGVGTQVVMAVGEMVEGTEALVVLAETKEEDPERRKQMVSGIRNEISSSLGVSPAEVLLVERGALPRTSSGKLERHKGGAIYAQIKSGVPLKPEPAA